MIGTVLWVLTILAAFSAKNDWMTVALWGQAIVLYLGIEAIEAYKAHKPIKIVISGDEE